MKVALVHDWLNQKVGGAEQVLFELAKLYPEAPIYSLVYNQKKFSSRIPPQRVITSRLQKLPGILKKHPRYLLPLIPKAVAGFEFKDYDVIISSSAAYSKNITKSPNTLHICYCHTPMRFAWDYWPQYLEEQHLGALRRFVVTKMVSKLRVWDYEHTAQVDRWIANSRVVAQRIKKYYHQEATVINPPADVQYFAKAATPNKQDYFVTLSVLAPYKKLELAIEAFNISGEPLKIIGSGSDEHRLKALARPNIEFMGYLSDATRRDVLAGARGLIFPQEEDFGIAVVEAMAAGTPVVAYGKGGALETVIAGKTGVFFEQQTPQALNKAVRKLLQQQWHQTDLVTQANRFDTAVFKQKIHHYVNQAYKDYVHSS